MTVNEKKCHKGDLEYIILFPEKEEKKDSIPVLVVSGWGASSLEQYKKPLLALSEERATIGVNTLSGTSREVIVLERGYRHILGQFSYVHVRKAIALLKLLRKNKAGVFDTVAYSEGAIIITIAALIEPLKFRNIIFVNPAGITPIRHPLLFLVSYLKEFLFGVGESVFRGTFWKKVDRVCEGTLRRFLSHPFRSLMEMSDISKTDIRENLFTLKEKGLKFSLLLAKNDQLFTKRTRLFAPEKLFLEIRENEGRHSNFIYGETKTVLEMLSVLENT